MHDERIEIELWHPGDLVYLHNPQESSKTGMRKLYNPWIGPLQVIEKVSDTSVLIRCPTRGDPAATKDRLWPVGAAPTHRAQTVMRQSDAVRDVSAYRA